MNNSESPDRKIAFTLISIIFFVLAFSLVNPALSKKPENVGNANKDLNETLNLNIYWDEKCTQKVTSINWGTLNPGTSKAVTFFIKNKEKTPIILDHYVYDFKPAQITNYLKLTWDYDGQKIGFKDTVKVSLELQILENAPEIENFNFKISIIAG